MSGLPINVLRVEGGVQLDAVFGVNPPVEGFPVRAWTWIGLAAVGIVIRVLRSLLATDPGKR